MTIVRRTPIVVHPVPSVLYPGQAFTYTFTVTLDDGTTHEVTGRTNHGHQGTLTTALRCFGRMEEHGYPKLANES